MASRLGDKLKQLRVIKGFTLRIVEERTGISNSYLNQIENGNVKNPSPHILHKLATFYNVPYAILLELAGYAVPGSKKKKRKTAGVAYSLMQDLTPEEEDEVLTFMRFVKQKRKKAK